MTHIIGQNREIRIDITCLCGSKTVDIRMMEKSDGGMVASESRGGIYIINAFPNDDVINIFPNDDVINVCVNDDVITSPPSSHDSANPRSSPTSDMQASASLLTSSRVVT